MDDTHTDSCCLRHGRSSRYSIFPYIQKWNVVDLQEEEKFPVEEPKVEEPFYQIENLLRWRRVKKSQQTKIEYLVLWKDYPIEEAQWFPTKDFMKPSELQKYIEEDDQ